MNLYPYPLNLSIRTYKNLSKNRQTSNQKWGTPSTPGGQKWGTPSAPWTTDEVIGFKTLLGASWGSSWGRLGASWLRLGASWGRLGGVLARLGHILRPRKPPKITPKSILGASQDEVQHRCLYVPHGFSRFTTKPQRESKKTPST